MTPGPERSTFVNHIAPGVNEGLPLQLAVLLSKGIDHIVIPPFFIVKQ
jgi:hypothetical protein